MTNNDFITPESLLALIAADAYYPELDTPEMIAAYCTELSPATDDRPAFDRLCDALSTDIADLLHNANLAELIPDADDFDNDAFDRLSDQLLDSDRFIDYIASIIMHRLP